MNWLQEFLLGDPDEIEIQEVDEIYLGFSPRTGPDHVEENNEIEHE